MEEILLEIIDRLRNRGSISSRELESMLRRANRGCGSAVQPYSKRKLLPYYEDIRDNDPACWESWGVTPEIERELLRTLQVKPRRSASGVATITAITKPWSCSHDCCYCPCDLCMPKSYIGDEPACQRARQYRFDPYLQVHMRLKALRQMGHSIDKVELIVLGGTWCDYPEGYRLWFVEQMFEALNDSDEVGERKAADRIGELEDAGLVTDGDSAARRIAPMQEKVDRGEVTFNQAVDVLYRRDPVWQRVSATQDATMDDILVQHRVNEHAGHRSVGLVVETRPDSVTPERLVSMRRMGCTKIQMGVQSTRQEILDANGRGIEVADIARAFDLARLFGFKIHAHFMVNLVGATPESDKADYDAFAEDGPFSPDEVKLYPCELVESTRLMDMYEHGEWVPYTQEELLDVLVHDVMATPSHIRMSRMVRDIPSAHVVAGNKVTNLRQVVDRRIGEEGLSGEVREIRFREIGTGEVDVDSLELETCPYETRATSERFLQWVTPEGRIAGFLRLSLPRREHAERLAGELAGWPGEPIPIGPDIAMIREVHIYGRAARLHSGSGSAQHMGLGQALVREAARIARESGYSKLDVISAVGTREYYRSLGFSDAYLYQQLMLD